MSNERKAAIVTGAASGIGLAFSKRLLERGYRVVLVDLNAERGAQVQKELGDDTLFIRCDVASWDSQAAMFKQAHAWAGHIDVFAANAGIEEQEHFYQLPNNDGEPVKPNTAVIDVNLFSVIYGLRLMRHYTHKSLKSGDFSRMVITSSLAGIYAFPAAPMYSAAKHALVGLTRSSSFKLRRDESISISTIAPSPVDTPISEITKKFVPLHRFTPMSLLIEALDRVIDEDMTGKVIECSNKRMYIRDPVPFSDENTQALIEDMVKF